MHELQGCSVLTDTFSDLLMHRGVDLVLRCLVHRISFRDGHVRNPNPPPQKRSIGHTDYRALPRPHLMRLLPLKLKDHQLWLEMWLTVPWFPRVGQMELRNTSIPLLQLTQTSTNVPRLDADHPWPNFPMWSLKWPGQARRFLFGYSSWLVTRATTAQKVETPDRRCG